jgi:hypothetical protein
MLPTLFVQFLAPPLAWLEPVLATLLIRNGAKVTGLHMIDFDRVCENTLGR